MNAIRIHEYGAADVLTYELIPTPEPEASDVLIRVHAASVNPIDWKTRRGSGISVDFPWTVGWDVAGVVEEIGADVTDFSAGDEVYGLINFPSGGGAYAEYATAPATELVHKPATLSFVEAAGMPMVSLTAWQALEAANVETDQRVLVHAAAGGVGQFAVQFALHRGAHVIGTASETNEEYLRELGVDEFVDYRDQQFEAVLDPVDVVIDGVGETTFERSLDLLRPGGTIVKLPTGGPTTEDEVVLTEYDIHAPHVSVRWNREQFAEITSLVESGEVAVRIDSTYPLTDAALAHERSESGHARGKVVIQPARDD